MLKKLVILAAVGFVAVAALKGTRIGSYIRSEVSAIREEAENCVSPEQEIARLRSEINELQKDRMKIVNQLAKETVEIRNLKEKTDELRTRQSADYDFLQSRAEAIKKANGFVMFGDRKLSLEQARAELQVARHRYDANNEALKSMDDTIGNREKIKENLEKQLDTLKNQQTDLRAAIDGLEAKLASLKLQQMESKYQTDDSRLAKIKEDIRSLRTKMDVEQEKLRLMPAELQSSSTQQSAKSVDEIMSGLNPPAKPGTATSESKPMPRVE